MNHKSDWSKAGVLLVLLAAGTVCSGAEKKVATVSPSEIERRQLVNRVDHGRQEVERQGDDTVREANSKLAAGFYMEACNLYRVAKVKFKKFNSPYFNRKIAFCDQQIARCYYLQAEEAIKVADKSSQRGDFESAINLCKEAIKYCPEQADKLESLIAQYEKRKVYAAQRDSVSADRLLPNKKNQDYQIEILLEQGRRLVAANELGAAVKKYQEIMLIDPYNEAAVKSLEGVYSRIGKIGQDRYRATHRRMVSETEWKFASPVFPEADAGRNTVNFVSGDAKKKAVLGNQAIVQKLNSIIIKEFSFSDIPISVVVNHLRELTKQHDPNHLGVNFVYLAKNMDRQENQKPEGNANPPAEGGDGTGPAAAPPLPAAGAGGPAAAQGAEGAAEGGDMPVQEKNVSFSLKDTSVMDVLRKFRDSYGIKYKITDNYVIIAPAEVSLGDMEDRVFNVDIKDFDSDEELMNRLIASGIPYGGDARIFYDRKIGCIYATNTPDNLDKTEKFLEEEYNRSEPMIQVMVKVVEISQKDINELAFNWQYAVNSKVSTTNADGDLKKTTVIQANSNELLRYYRPNDYKAKVQTQVADSQLSYVWENSDGSKIVASMFALNWADSGDVLYSPRVTVLNGQVGQVVMGTLRYFPDEWELIDVTESNEEIGWRMLDATPQPTLENEQTLGFPLSVQPEIVDGPEGRIVRVKVLFQIRTFVDWMKFDARTKDTENNSTSEDGEYYQMPIFNDRFIDTTAHVHDGDTVLVGGVSTDLTKSYSDKIPILGDIPFIGRFFQSRYSEAEKGNLLIFLSCRIVNPDGSAKYPDGRRPNGLASFGQNY